MKNIGTKGVLLIIITICLCMAVVGISASADSVFYVNTNGDTVSSLKGLYAVDGSGSTAVLGDSVWAITSTGTEQFGSSSNVVPHCNLTPKTPTAPPTGTITVKTSVVRVGLDYYYTASRNGSVAVARLQNYVGWGYAFGFYDANRNFFELGETPNTGLTIVTDRNTKVSAGMIGCFHVRLPGSYPSFESAASAASVYDGFPAYYDGIFYALAGNYESREDAQAAVDSGIPGEVFSASNRCVTVTKTGSTQILFEFDCGKSYSLAIHPLSTNSKAETTYNGGYRYYGDFQFIRTTGENMTVVNVLPLEDYVKGVVPYEMSPSWPIEALKAQALCARTYVMRNINSYNSAGFDVTDDTYCQAYLGTSGASKTSDRAVDETAGLYVTYNGSLCDTLYFSSDGGATEDSENVFASKVMYLRAVLDPYEADITFANKTWSEKFTADQITNKLRSKGYNISTIVSVTPEYTNAGNMGRIVFTDVNGKSVTVSKSNCYSVLGLKSVHFTIEEVDGVYYIEGGGWGHNVGMSQWGAYSMASVHGYSYAEIIGFYYTGVTISRGI